MGENQPYLVLLHLRRTVGTLHPMEQMQLSSEEHESLLRLARSAILRSLGESAEEPALSDRLLSEKRGAFVTLRQGTELRGCIGYVEPVETIAEAIRQLAVKSASEDTRFASVHPSEMHSLSIEISVLSPVRTVRGPDDIRIGRHGVVVEKGWARGLLLPEVAVEAGWDQITFLRHCCLKAGLPPDAWREPDARIYVFMTEHFGERNPIEGADGHSS